MTIPYKDLRLFTYSNDHLLNCPPRAIVLSFIGLGGNLTMTDKDSEYAVELAQNGIIFLSPYINPWAWMNRAATDLTDNLVETIFERYTLRQDCPLVSTGSSMGGFCALSYMLQANRTPTACAVNCPVCDLPYHYIERPDTPRTILSAYSMYPMPLMDAIASVSPCQQAARMPKVPYFVAHGDEDDRVSKSHHSDQFVSLMRNLGHRITYIEVPGKKHADLIPAVWPEYHRFILDACGVSRQK